MTTIYKEFRFRIPTENRTGKPESLRDTLNRMLFVDYFEEVEEATSDPEGNGPRPTELSQIKGQEGKGHEKD